MNSREFLRIVNNPHVSAISNSECYLVREIDHATNDSTRIGSALIANVT